MFFPKICLKGHDMKSNTIRVPGLSERSRMTKFPLMWILVLLADGHIWAKVLTMIKAANDATP